MIRHPGIQLKNAPSGPFFREICIHLPFRKSESFPRKRSPERFFFLRAFSLFLYSLQLLAAAGALGVLKCCLVNILSNTSHYS